MSAVTMDGKKEFLVGITIFHIMSLTEAECRHLLSLYDKALTSRIDVHRSKNGAKDLLQLDSWRLNELPKSVRERTPSFMSKEELEKLMDCKLYSPLDLRIYQRSRGKFRPRLKQLISSNVAPDVKSSTQKGFSELGSPLTIESIITATKTLSELKGVGPATATMVLQASSDEVPFMSDEAMLQVFEGDKTKLKYDLKTCKIFIENIYEIVTSLKKGIGLFEGMDDTQNLPLRRWSALFSQRNYLERRTRRNQ
jgi:hypothetical protein